MLERKTTFSILSASKTIGFFGGVCLLFNAITGPGIPFTPQLFSVQGSGLVATLVIFLSVSLISGMSVLLLIEAMQAIPGNKYFQGTVEFGTLINFYYGKITHIFGQLLLYGALQSNAIQSIVISAQTTDNLIIDLFGKTCGFSTNEGWLCVNQKSVLNPSPFQCTPMLFSFGLLFIIVLVIPMGFMNFDDNVSVQIFSFITAIAIGIQWIVSSILMGWDLDRISILSSNPRNLGATIGTIILNMGFTTVVPSWINVKKNEVSAQRVVWTGVTVGILFYTLLVGLATEPSESASVFPYLQVHGNPMILTRVTISLYTYVMLVTSIPILCIVSHQNLIQNNVANKYVSIFISFIIPWFFSIPFQAGIGLSAFITWYFLDRLIFRTSAFFVAPANFIVPIGIYLSCVKFRRGYNQSRYLSDHQRDLLKTIHSSSETIGKFIDESGKVSRIPSRRPELVADQSELRLGIDSLENMELEEIQESQGYGRSIQHAGKTTLRNRTSTRSSNESTSPNSPNREDHTVKTLHTVSTTENKQLKIPYSPKFDISQMGMGGALMVPKGSRVSRSLSERPRAKDMNSSSTIGLLPETFSHRRASADEYIYRQVSDSIRNTPTWYYEDVPDPDAEDWGKLNGILSVLNPEKHKHEERPVIHLEEVTNDIDTIKTVATISVPDHQLENVSSSLQQRFFVPKDSQQELLNSDPTGGLGYVDSELESITSRNSSLPADPHYVGPIFRSLPTWIPIRTIYVAIFLLFITSALNIMIVVFSITQLNEMPQCSTEKEI